MAETSMPDTIWFVLLIAWAVLILLGAYVANEKRRLMREGMILAALFGPFGVLIVALLPTLTADERDAVIRRVEREWGGAPEPAKPSVAAAGNGAAGNGAADPAVATPVPAPSLIVFTCPTCTHKTNVPSDLIGRKVQCRKCNAVTVVPDGPAVRRATV